MEECNDEVILAPEVRKKLAGGETTGQRQRNTNRALKGREKGTRRLAGNIAGEQSHVSRAPTGAQAMWCGPVPVVSPPANLFRASGSGLAKTRRRYIFAGRKIEQVGPTLEIDRFDCVR